jgi:AraC family ethanolamine operon transcriptional activator
MTATADLQGWDLQCLQTSAGRLEGSARDLHIDGMQILQESFKNVTTNQFGAGPAGAFTFGVPLRMQQDGLFNGRRWSQGICAWDNRREMDSIVPPMELFSVVVRRELLCDYVLQTEHVDLEYWLSRGGVTVNQPAVTRALSQQLDDLMSACFRGDIDLRSPAAERLVRNEVLEQLAPIIVEHLGAASSVPLYDASHMHIVRRARRYALDQLSEPLQVVDLCQYVRVSRRSLQNSFQAVLGISPLTYLRTLRLNRARRRLLSRDTGLMVRDVAEECGFWHLSRFGLEYRRMFGELPSDTLRQAHANPGLARHDDPAPATEALAA